MKTVAELRAILDRKPGDVKARAELIKLLGPHRRCAEGAILRYLETGGSPTVARLADKLLAELYRRGYDYMLGHHIPPGRPALIFIGHGSGGPGFTFTLYRRRGIIYIDTRGVRLIGCLFEVARLVDFLAPRIRFLRRCRNWVGRKIKSLKWRLR